MSVRSIWGRRARADYLTAVVIAAMLSLAAVSFECVGASGLLPTNEMTGLRGGNQNLYSGTFPCDHLTKGLMACQVAGGNCVTCYEQSYSDTGSTTGGGLDSGAPMAGNCGDLYNGTCDVNLNCNPNARGDTGKACTKPPAPPQKQNQ